LHQVSRRRYRRIRRAFERIGAAIAGSMGLASRPTLDPERCHPSQFQPVHGAVPDIVGQGTANPIDDFRFIQLVLDFLGAAAAGDLVMRGVDDTWGTAAASFLRSQRPGNNV
jgi:isocitrate/isopropylmalate dehydrogenase